LCLSGWTEDFRNQKTFFVFALEFLIFAFDKHRRHTSPWLEFSGYSALSRRAWWARGASERRLPFLALGMGSRLASKDKPTHLGSRSDKD
jgi:hypothetical protein